jgi:hypothetical protein
MSLDRDLAGTGKASTRDLATVPARPQIEPRELSTGGPVVLEQGADASWKHALGWEDRSERRGGRCFIIVKATFTGSFRVIERFPMTDAGWRRAWKALVKLDRDGAATALEVLADRAGAAGRKADLARLAAQTIGVLADGRYIPGSGELPDIDGGSRLDVRFLADRVVFLPPGSARVLAEFSYPDVAAVEISHGRIRRWTAGQQAALGIAFGLEVGMMASQMIRIKSVVRFETGTCELFVVDDQTEPDVLRMWLSPALWAIREAREAAGRPGPADGAAAVAGGPASVVDQLAKLASLLESGLLTREEFDRLKDALLAGLDGGPPVGQEEKRFTVDLGRSAWPGVPSVAPIPPVPPTADPPFTPGWPGSGAG